MEKGLEEAVLSEEMEELVLGDSLELHGLGVLCFDGLQVGFEFVEPFESSLEVVLS